MSRVGIKSRQDGAVVYLDFFAVSNKGEGRKAYNQWEQAQPPDVERVVIESVEGAEGFWRKMGFTRMYLEDPDPDFNVPAIMVKGINGYPTPTPVDYVTDDAW
jgi:hypothetical protein